MTAYAKDFFTAIGSQWTSFVVNGSDAIVAGGRKLAKSSGVAWRETGLSFTAGQTFVKGDAVIVQFSLPDLDAADTYNLLGLNLDGTALNENRCLANYIYPAAGIKSHGSTLGVCTDLTVNTAMAIDELYTLRWSCAPVSGNLTIDIKGGVFGSSYVAVATANPIDATGYTNLHMQFNLYNTKSDITLAYYEWYDSGGADPLSVQDLEGEAISTTEIDLTWTAFNLATGYDIYRDGDILDSVGIVDHYEDTDVVADTSYEYTIYATGLFGTSDVSSTAIIDTPEDESGTSPLFILEMA